METSNTYRHNFSSTMMSALYEFSKVHQYDAREDYKEVWVAWMEENEVIICEEIKLLKSKGFEGDVREKMYKSGRYYFRKKNDHGERHKEKQNRKKYVALDHEFLDLMDNHITRSDILFKPSTMFESFCILYEHEINEEESRMEQEHNMSHEEFNKKIKKTYKNRYFQNNNINK